MRDLLTQTLGHPNRFVPSTDTYIPPSYKSLSTDLTSLLWIRLTLSPLSPPGHSHDVELIPLLRQKFPPVLLSGHNYNLGLTSLL